jgi:hypothetical protein
LTVTLHGKLKVHTKIMKSVFVINSLISLILLLVVDIIIGYEERG